MSVNHSLPVQDTDCIIWYSCKPGLVPIAVMSSGNGIIKRLVAILQSLELLLILCLMNSIGQSVCQCLSS